MASENDKTLNINIYKDNSKEIETSQNKSETYIILANEELNNKLREQLEHISNLDEQIRDLETDNERMEKSITYQRGLLHNFNAIKCLQGKKITYYENYNSNMSNSIKKDIEFFTYLYRLYYSDMITLCVAIFIINYIDSRASMLTIFNNIITTILFSFLIPFSCNINIGRFKELEKKYKNIKDTISDEVKKFNDEIDEISSKTDFISELIDTT